jgi:thiamine biosynthesis lipoprotein
VTALRSRSEALMGTIVTIATVGEAGDAVARAFEWFREVEARCSRFDRQSELSQLSATVGKSVPVSDVVFETLRFAVQIADLSAGAFDPVVGGAMIARGFNRHYATGEITPLPGNIDSAATFRDVSLDPDARTVTLERPLALDLGGVAKGLAIDLAAKELESIRNFSIDAGGDLYLGGTNDDGEEWSVGIRHPRKDHKVIEIIRVSDKAVCTSGDYERGPHLLDPKDGSQAAGIASATVIAPTAMLADAASTAAFVMGPADGIAFCRRIGVEAILFTPDLERRASHE